MSRLVCTFVTRSHRRQVFSRRDTSDECSKILNTVLFLFTNKMLVFGARTHKTLVRIANREHPDHPTSAKASDLGLPCLSRPFWQATTVLNFRTFAVLTTYMYVCKARLHPFANINEQNRKQLWILINNQLIWIYIVLKFFNIGKGYTSGNKTIIRRNCLRVI